MKKFVYEYNMPPYQSKALRFYCDNFKIGTFDIETTGLDPEKNQIILIGFLQDLGDRFILYQYFAENLFEEKAVISAFLEDLSPETILTTYNGDTFDFPFLKTRMEKNQVTYPFRVTYSLDLYRILKYYSPLKSFLPNLKQKTVEVFMGLGKERTDEISGGESVSLYYNFVHSKDDSLQEKILLHNRDDVLQLYRLLPVLEKANLHKAFFTMGFPVRIKSPKANSPTHLKINKIKITSACLEVFGQQQYNGINYIVFGNENAQYHLDFKADTNDFSLSIPFLHHSRMSQISVMDLTGLQIESNSFEKYPQYEDGLMVLKQNNEIYYLQVNDFVKTFLNSTIGKDEENGL